MQFWSSASAPRNRQLLQTPDQVATVLGSSWSLGPPVLNLVVLELCIRPFPPYQMCCRHCPLVRTYV